jgi:3-oxoacyl-[acyl-carrier protein] reductase
MRERRWGRVIGVTSVSVKEPIEQLILSNVFRSGVTALFKTLAREQARHGITFNTVLPGLTDTERLAELYEAQAEREGIALEDLMARVARALPLGRLNRPDELGELVAFLASEAASGITGDALAVDGGQLRGLL